jgi:hypothetical protein
LVLNVTSPANPGDYRLVLKGTISSDYPLLGHLKFLLMNIIILPLEDVAPSHPQQIYHSHHSSKWSGSSVRAVKATCQQSTRRSGSTFSSKKAAAPKR